MVYDPSVDQDLAKKQKPRTSKVSVNNRDNSENQGLQKVTKP